MSETTRDLVVRVRVERIGSVGDFRSGEVKGYRDEVDRTNQSLRGFNSTSTQTSAETNRVADIIRKSREEFAQLGKGVKDSSDSIADFRRHIKATGDEFRANSERIRGLIDRKREMISAEKAGAAATQEFYLVFRRQYDLGAVETVNRLARGIAWVAAANKDNAAEMARNVLVFQAGFDLSRGLIETLIRLRGAYIALTAAVAAYNTQQAASSARKAVDTVNTASATYDTLKFLGLGGLAGRAAKGLASRGTSAIRNPYVGGIASLAGGFIVGDAAWRFAGRGEDSIFESLFTIDKGAMGPGSLRSSNALRAAQMVDFERSASAQRSGEWDILSRYLPNPTAAVEANIRSNQAAMAGSSNTEQRLILSSRILEDFRRLDSLLQNEARIKEDTARQGIQAETARLNLIQKERDELERLRDLKDKETKQAASAFLDMKPWERNRVGAAFDRLNAGQDLTRRDRDLLGQIGTGRIREALGNADLRQAIAGGMPIRLIEQELQERNKAAMGMDAKASAIAQSQATIDTLKKESEAAGKEMADRVKLMLRGMLEAFREQTDAESRAEMNAKGAQGKAAGR